MLGRRVEDAALNVLTGLIAANKARNKKVMMYEVDAEIEKLRILVRLSCDMKFISLKKYALLSEKVNELGRMLGGWMKWEGK